jgi:hypothetical protein
MLNFLALTILLGQPISSEAFSSSTPSSLAKPITFATKPSPSFRHIPRISDAVGANRHLAALSIGSDGDVSTPVEISLNGGNLSPNAELKSATPTFLVANGDGSVPAEISVNGGDYSSLDAELKSGTPPFPIVLWRFTRPHTIIGSAVAIPSIFLLAAPTYKSFFTVRSFASLMYAAIPALFMNLYITGLNQITDVEIDKINVSSFIFHLLLLLNDSCSDHGIYIIASHLSEAILAHG